MGSAQRRAWGARSADGVPSCGGVIGKGIQSGPKHFLLSSMAVQATEPIFPHPLQRLLLQDLHDSHICNSLLVAESEEDIWKSETPYTSYRQRVMPTDGMDISWSCLSCSVTQVPKKLLSSMLWPQLCPMFFTDYSVEESYQPRDYLAATMQFMPGHFACGVVWSTLIHVHSRLKMGPNMGVSRGA